jgi:hypothetical protein
MHLMGYWHALRGTRDFVTLEELEPASLGSLWAHCFVLNAAKQPSQMIFQHLGERIAAASKVPTDLWNASEIPQNTILAKILEISSEVLQEQQPLVSSGEFVDYRDRRCLYRGIVLPLGSSREAVEYLLGGGRCKIVDPAEP